MANAAGAVFIQIVALLLIAGIAWLEDRHE